MDEPKICTVCGALLVGPFEPAIPLALVVDGAQAGDPPSGSVVAQSWLCPACGLLAWYVPGEKLDVLREELSEGEQVPARPGQPYERRAQILRMLRRVRRM